MSNHKSICVHCFKNIFRSTWGSKIALLICNSYAIIWAAGFSERDRENLVDQDKRTNPKHPLTDLINSQQTLGELPVIPLVNTALGYGQGKEWQLSIGS